jgi:hypothetical protein
LVPGSGHGTPASVTAGVALDPRTAQVATVAFHPASTRGAAGTLTNAVPTLAGTAEVEPVPVPTPVP